MIKNYIKRAWCRVRRDPLLITLLIFASTYFMLYYITDPLRPAGMFSLFGFHDKAIYFKGWFGYYDQGSYLREAHTLASLKFSQLHSTYSYGVGYPLVAVPAIWLGFNADPFVFFNMFAFVFAVYAIYVVTKRLISPTAGFLAGLGLVFATPLIHYVDQPWNSTVCLVTMSGILLVLATKKINRWHFFIIGLLLGWSFAARYIDVIWLGILAAASLYRGSFSELSRKGVYTLIGLSLIVLPVAYSHYKIFGSPFRTPYVNHLGVGGINGSDQGLRAYSLKRVPRAGLGIFISPRLAGSAITNRGLLIDFFWALAAIPGVFILIKRSERRLFFIVFIPVFIAATVFYLSFRASEAGSIKYGELHYFKMFWPVLVLLATAYIDRIVQPKK